MSAGCGCTSKSDIKNTTFSKEEIARLKEIIERAAYSNEAIEATEAKFCYGIYMRLKKHPKKKA